MQCWIEHDIAAAHRVLGDVRTAEHQRASLAGSTLTQVVPDAQLGADGDVRVQLTAKEKRDG